MSSTLAIDLPDFAPYGSGQLPRHIEIVATRQQKKARPRVIYAVITVAGLFVILMAQLLLSISLSNGAYQISSLQQTQKELVRDKEALAESVSILESPQNLAGRAADLGMVNNTGSQGFLSLLHGVTRAPVAASATNTIGADASTLTPNALITQSMIDAGKAVAAGAAATTTDPSGVTETGNTAVTGASQPTSPDASVTSTASTLPAPITH